VSEHPIDEAEVVDGLPVLVDVHELEQPTRGAAVQTAAVAATGFFAGVAATAVLGRQLQRHASRVARARRAPVPVPDVLSTRTFLVSVHLLGRREDRDG